MFDGAELQRHITVFDLTKKTGEVCYPVTQGDILEKKIKGLKLKKAGIVDLLVRHDIDTKKNLMKLGMKRTPLVRNLIDMLDELWKIQPEAV